MFATITCPSRDRSSGHRPSLLRDSLFADLFNSEAEGQAKQYWPPVDIHELPERFELFADLPGVKQENIKIEFSDGILSLEALRHKEAGGEGSQPRLFERPEHSFKRAFALGDLIKADQIEAAYENGVLKVTIPKAEKVVPKVIPIQVKKP